MYTISPVQVWERLSDVASSPIPFALVVVMLAASTLLYLVGKVILGRGFDAATTKAAVVAGETRLTGWKAFWAALPFLVVIGVAVVPHLAVVLTSLSATGKWYK